MSSFHFDGDQCAGEIDHGFEIARQFFKASGNAAEVLKPGKQIFDQVAQFVEMSIKFRIRLLAVRFSWNNGIHSGGSGVLPNRFGVVAFVGDEIPCGADGGDEWVRKLGVVDFTPSDFKIDRMSMRIGGHVQFSGDSASGYPDSAFFTTPSSTCMLMSADIAAVGEYPFRINVAS